MRGDDARRSRRRRDQGRKPRRRSVSRLPGRDCIRRISRPTTATSAASSATSSRPADRELFERLVSEADVYIQNFRPGTAEKLGAGPTRMRELNPRLVYCSISGFGGERPVRRAPQLRLGGAGVVRVPERGGRRGSAALPRSGARRRDHRDLRGASACWARCWSAPAPAAANSSKYPCWKPWRISPSSRSRRIFALGAVPKSSDRPRLAQAYILRTADGKLIAIHLSSLEKFWLGLVKALDADELTRDVRFSERLARIANYEALGAELDRRFRRHSQQEWCAATQCQRRAVRAHQRHRRRRRGSAGRAPRAHRPGERRAAGWP